MLHAEEPLMPAADVWRKSAWRAALRKRLLAWYAIHQRELPWRGQQDPYPVWVSEIMLQQTQVATVIPHFQRFLQRFPNIASLAQADQEEVLRHWEGLGYYRRARSLHAAARKIRDEYDGCFPAKLQDAMQLPGVGRYTAGAILSISREQRLPILEANTQRLYSRLIALRRDPRAADAQRLLWEFAETILPQKRVGDFNQALMELGALICLPKSPKCLLCPLATLCQAKRDNLQDNVPLAAPKQQYEDVRDVAVVVVRQASLLLRQCGAEEHWAGLWDFPRVRLDSATASEDVAEQVRLGVRKTTGLVIELGERFARLRHAVTRYRIQLDCHHARLRRGGALTESAKWIPHAKLADLPMNTTGRKIVRHLEE